MQSEIKTEIVNIPDIELLTSLKNHFIISVLDTTGKIIYSNNNFKKVFKASGIEDALQGSQLLRCLVHSKEVYWEICKTMSAGQKWQGVLFHKENNDRSYCLETTISPIKDVHGEIMKYVAVSNDISEHHCKQVDNTTFYSDEIRLLQSITDDTLFITKQGKIFNTSQSVINHIYDGIVGSNVYDFINPVNHDDFEKRLDLVFNEGKISKYQFIGKAPNGKKGFYVTKIKPVFNLQNEVIYATLKTKKYKDGLKVNKELKAIETKYSNIFQSINVGIIVVANSQGNIIEWNKGAENAFGYIDSEIIGEHLTRIISKKHVEVGVKDLLLAKDKLDNNLYGESIEMVGLKKSGDEFPVELTMSNWQNDDEKFYCAIMLDVSKRKKMEDKLRQTTKDLELFLYRSAHDLKAPLTSAEGLLGLLKDENLNSKASLLVNMLDETLAKGRLLLDDLAFASIISEKRRELSSIKFQETVEDIMTSLKGIANFDSIYFKIEIRQNSDFYFNQELMDSILQNLIHNTLCFAKPQSDTHTPFAQVNVEVSDKKVYIRVSDNGVGIHEDRIDKVFDLYSRSENSTGTGLGLYIVKRIIENFQGDIIVNSTWKEYTSFEVTLPNLIQENRNDD